VYVEAKDVTMGAEELGLLGSDPAGVFCMFAWKSDSHFNRDGV
jgi:hypothetical protein